MQKKKMKTRNNKIVGLKPKQWFLCTHCKKDFKKNRNSGILTCHSCKIKGLNDESAIDTAWKIINEVNISKKNDRDCENRDEEDFFEEIFTIDCGSKYIRAEKGRRGKKFWEFLNTYSSIYEYEEFNGHTKNDLILDVKKKKVIEKLPQEFIKKPIEFLGAESKNVKAAMVLITSAIPPEEKGIIKKAIKEKLPHSHLYFHDANERACGHTIIKIIAYSDLSYKMEYD